MPKTLESLRVQRTVDAVREACARVTDPDELLRTVAARLRDVVPHDAALWFGADPATALPTSPVVALGLDPAELPAFWRRELLGEDALLFRDLAGAQRSSGTLLEATGGLPGRSARFRELLAPAGHRDELRAALRRGGIAWGFASLLRGAGHPPFSPAERDVVDLVCADVADALRRAALRGLPRPDRAPDGPGLVMFDADGAAESLNDDARAWLEELPATATAGGLPSPVVAAVLRARAIAEGRDGGRARLRVRGRSGRWIVVHASCLRRPGGGIGQTALVIEPARAAEIAPLIVMACELSGREQEITSLIARGVSTQDIAGSLYLSRHTVRDHIKAIFEKVGVSSRGELVARLFAEPADGGIHHRPLAA